MELVSLAGVVAAGTPSIWDDDGWMNYATEQVIWVEGGKNNCVGGGENCERAVQVTGRRCRHSERLRDWAGGGPGALDLGG